MNRFNFLTTTFSILGILVAPSAFAKGERLVGAGFAFPSANQSTVVNASTLPEAGQMSLQGLWNVDDSEANASLVGTSGSLGYGLGYRSITGSNVLDAGVGFGTGSFMLGVSAITTTDFEDFDASISGTFDLSGMRLALGYQNITADTNLISVGLGFMVDALLVSLDVHKNLPWGDPHIWLFDASVAYNAGKIGIGFGYTSSYSSFAGMTSFDGGDFHADLAYAVSGNFILEGHYNLTPYFSNYGEWSAGATFKF